MRGHGSQWFSHKMNNRHPLPICPIWPNFELNGLDWQCCLAGSSNTAPRIFIFSIVLGAEYSSYMKSIETHARAFLTHNILSIGTVNSMSRKRQQRGASQGQISTILCPPLHIELIRLKLFHYPND